MQKCETVSKPCLERVNPLRAYVFLFFAPLRETKTSGSRKGAKKKIRAQRVESLSLEF
jgi:hypothetical protein